MQKPCRHLGSLSLGKLSDRLAASSPLTINSCNSCTKTTKTAAETTVFACLTCLECFCLPSHLNHHARERNHPLSFNVSLLSEASDLIEKEFYCALCSSSPKLREPGKKERINLEKIKGFFLENQKNQVQNDSTVLADSKSSTTDNISAASQNSEKPKGLVNLGNTCFMNSALQLLAATLHRHGPLKTSSSSPIWLSLLHHLEDIYAANVNKTTKKATASASVNPREFLGLLSGKQKKFASMQQQDAHDFLRLLFNSVPEAPQIELFGGKFVSRVVCERCRKVSDTVEPFLDISLALPDESASSLASSLSKLRIKSEDEDNDCTSTNTNSSDIVSINELLEHWNKKIQLQGENGYYCESCSPQDTQILQNASLQFFLTDPLPPFLILHLQRFKTQISMSKGSGRKSKKSEMCLTIEKDDRPVAFPLNLTIKSDLCSQDSNYRLYGYIIHEGSSTSCGHYTAVVSSPSSNDCWFYISDTSVKQISKTRALDSDSYTPYLLFYQKI